jgi:hypothetical protein
MYSGKAPFPELTEMAVICGVTQRRRPDLPKEGTPIPENIWSVMKLCWAHQPTMRPHINKVVKDLEAICHANRIEHSSSIPVARKVLTL